MGINSVPIFDINANEREDFSLSFWLYDNPLPIAGITEVTPINVNCRYHGKSTSNVILIGGAQCDDGRWSNANGIQTITVVDAHNFTINGSSTNGPSTKNCGAIGTLRDCTGGSVTCEIRQTPEDPNPLLAPTITTVLLVQGSFKLVITAAQLNTLVAGGFTELAYDIFYIDSLDIRHREQQGAFIINRSITKS